MKNLGPIQLGIVVVVILIFAPIIVLSGPTGTAVSAPAPKSAALGLPAPVVLPTEQPAEPPIELQPTAAMTGSVLGSYEMDLSSQTFNQDEALNVRWSLIRRSSEGAQLWTKANGTDWAAVQNTSMAGSITIPQGTWSFTSIFRAGVGYKRASGILAGGHCALASAFKMAADDAGLPTEIDKKHSIPIPGFGAENSVAILWGGNELDLRVKNDTGKDLRFVWSISGDKLRIDVVPAPSDILGRAEVVRVSWYDPRLGGPNCAHFVDGECVSRMSSGQPWQEWMDRAVACPKEWPFGTIVRLVDHGKEYTCMDRGGSIVYEYGYAWIDTMTDAPVIAWGANTQAELIFPE